MEKSTQIMEFPKTPKKTFFIGDTRFYDRQAIETGKRPFKTVDRMNDAMIHNWNRVVGKDDDVYILGNFCRYDDWSDASGDANEILGALYGSKYLIVGSNEACSLKHSSYSGQYVDVYKRHFQRIYLSPTYVRDAFYLSYKEITPPRNYKQDGKNDDSLPILNLYGANEKPLFENSFSVAAERIDYTPIELFEIHNYIDFGRRTISGGWNFI